ncbi:unnamed protein product [Sphagnum balticum]
MMREKNLEKRSGNGVFSLTLIKALGLGSWVRFLSSRSSGAGATSNRLKLTAAKGAVRTEAKFGHGVKEQAWMQDRNLDKAIWDALPEELLERVLAYLPLTDLARLATVCKRWQSLIHCPLFLQTHAENSSSRPSYGPVRYSVNLSENGKFHWSGYCKSTNKWQKLPPLSLPCLAGKKVWSGTGGLLCFYNRDNVGRLTVCNPVTNRWRELPPMNQKWRWPCVTHMIVDQSSKSYKIILAGNEAYPRNSITYRSQSTEVYDSVLDTWQLSGCLPKDLYLDTQDAALHNGLLYCTAQKTHTQTSDSLSAYDALIAYDVQRGLWTEVSSQLPDSSAYQTPLLCGGHLVIVVAPLDNDSAEGRFYVLDARTKNWSLLTIMPQSLHKKLGFWGVCVAHGSQILVVSDTSTLVVVYDMGEGTWQELSSHQADSNFEFITPTIFSPNVNAIP